MDDPGPVHRCFGCTHLSYDGVVDGSAVRFMDDDMQQFMGSCVDSYLKLVPNAKLTKAPTPFVDPHVIPNGYAGSSDVEGELDIGDRGELAPHAASVLMKVLYGARKVRWDLLKCVNMLAKRITKWTTGCDKALHGLMCYIFQSKHKVLRGYVGDTAANLRLKLFTDADLAGDRPSYRSTSGVVLVLWGPNTFFPLAAMSKRQSSVSHSTPEAEVVAASIGIRMIGTPQLDLWDTITK